MVSVHVLSVSSLKGGVGKTTVTLGLASAAFARGVRTLVVDGPPTETIDEVVRRRGADLVIAASRGATATRMVLLGTVAEGLVTEAPCDVLIARTKAPFRRP